MKKILKFPPKFLWGAAISAYQAEGGIENSDWSLIYPAKEAVNHYQLFEQDFDWLTKLNLNAFRFSFEWSRIEPQEGIFDEKEINYYKKYLLSLKKRGITTIATLFHFTSPLWIEKMGTWRNKKTVFYFQRFAEKIFEEYRDLVDYWITINEPIAYLGFSYLIPRWPPAVKERKTTFQRVFDLLRALKNLILAHQKIFQSFHQKQKTVKISIAHIMAFFEPANKNSFLDRFTAFLCHYFVNDYFLERIKNYLDFIGLNYYFHQKVKAFKLSENENKLVSDFGWEIYPQGIYHLLKHFFGWEIYPQGIYHLLKHLDKKYRLPILITENGVADQEDRLRKDFIKNHLFWIHRAIEEGVNVFGYLHWSLLDNIEWDFGKNLRFGLLKVDYQTQERIPRESAFFYKEVAKNNFLEF